MSVDDIAIVTNIVCFFSNLCNTNTLDIQSLFLLEKLPFSKEIAICFLRSDIVLFLFGVSLLHIDLRCFAHRCFVSF